MFRAARATGCGNCFAPENSPTGCAGSGLKAERDVLEIFTASAGDYLDHWFESAPIKAAFGFDSVVGNYASPYAPGSAYVLLHHCFGEVNGVKGQWGHAIGGMGAITQAMAKAAARARRRDSYRESRARSADRKGPRRRCRHAEGRGVSRENRRRQCQSEAALSRSRPARRAGRRFPGSHRALALRLRHVPHECRFVRTAGFLRAAGTRRGRASHRRHHHRAVAALHGGGLFRCAALRLVAKADRRNADSLDARRHAGAEGRACREPVLPACRARSCPTANHGTIIATRSPIS